MTEARSRLTSPSGSGRELSRQELAEAVNTYLWQTHRIIANLDGTYIGHLEQGRYRWPSARRREAFRHVLSVESDSTIGFYITRGRRRTSSKGGDAHERPDGEVNRRTLLKPLAVAAVPAGPRAKAAELIMALTSLGGGETYQRAADIEPKDLTKRVAAVRSSYQHGRYATALERIPRLLADLRHEPAHVPGGPNHWSVMAAAYQVASGLLLKTDDPALASIAADRSIAFARRSGDPLTIASSVRAVVHTLMANGYPTRASELGDAGTAVHLAERIDVRRIAIPERRAALMIDAARAYTQWGKYENALDAIRSAEQHAPEEVRSRRSVIQLIAAIAQRAPAPVERRARTYAQSIGVEL